MNIAQASLRNPAVVQALLNSSIFLEIVPWDYEYWSYSPTVAVIPATRHIQRESSIGYEQVSRAKIQESLTSDIVV